MPAGSIYAGSFKLSSGICSPLMVAYTSRIIVQAIPARVIKSKDVNNTIRTIIDSGLMS